MKIENRLAKAFVAVAEHERAAETTASGVLAIVRGVTKLTVAAFDKLVQAAYKVNGWNERPGRPAAGTSNNHVPDTVRTYVTIIRRAIRAKMKIGKYKTFSALRTALEGKSGRNRKRKNGNDSILQLPAPVKESFVGVEIENAEPNGALFHDLGVLFAKLPADHQALLGRQLNQLYHKYLPLVPRQQRKAA